MNMVYASTCLCLPLFLQYPIVFRVQVFNSLLKFIPKYLIFVVVTIWNGIAFLVSLSECSLLVYKSATNLRILLLYPATLPNSCIQSSCFLVESLRVFNVRCHVIWKKWQFYFFLSNLDVFYLIFLSGHCG